MPEKSEIFDNNYQFYCNQIATVDLEAVSERLGCRFADGRLTVPFFDQDYHISRSGISDASGQRPGYLVCIILAKYVLLCPETPHPGGDWVSFRDFRQTSHFTNVNYFASDTEQAIVRDFTDEPVALARACNVMGGTHHEEKMPYDLAMQFRALPRIALLLLFNSQDDEFPASATVLFNKDAECYLDPESLAMTSAFLARSLKVIHHEIESLK